MPRRLGPSGTVEGAVDVELDDGAIVPVHPAMVDAFLGPEQSQQIGGPGASAPLAVGPETGPPDMLSLARGEPAQAPQPIRVAADVPQAPDPLALARQPQGGLSAEEQRRRRLAAEQIVAPPEGSRAPQQTQAPAAQVPGEQPAQQAPGGTVFARGASPAGGAGGALSPDQALEIALAQRGGGGGGPRVTTTATNERTVLQPTEGQARALGEISTQRQAGQQRGDALVTEGAEREAQVLTQQAQAVQQLGQSLDDLERQRAEQRRIQEQARQEYTQRADALTQQVASGRIDPNRIWRDEGNAARIAGAVSVGIGALLQGLTGGENLALGIINDAIDRDIAAQQGNLDVLRGAAQDTRALAGLAGEDLDDFDAQTALQKEAMLADVERQIAALDLANQPQEVRDAAEALLLRVQQERLAAREQGIMANVDRTVIRQESVQRAGGGGRRGITREDVALAQDFQELFGGGEEAELDREGIRDLSKRRQDLVRAQASVRRIRQIIGDREDVPGVGVLAGRIPDLFFEATGQEDASNVRRATRDALGAVLRARSGAAITDEEIVREEEAMGLSETATNRQYREGLAALEELLRETEGVVNATVSPANLQRFERRRQLQGGGTSTAGERPRE